MTGRRSRSAQGRRAAALSAAGAAGVAVALTLAGPGGAPGSATAARPEQASAPSDTTTQTTQPAATTTTAAAQTTPAPAGPALRTDLPCYLEDRSVALHGSGLPAGAAYTVTLDGAPLGSGRVNADGTLSGRLPSGRVTGAASRLRHAIAVAVTGSGPPLQASFYVTRFGASFAPDAGNPATLVVRFSVLGFGVGPAAPKDPTPRPLYLHYIAPTGRQIELVKLGRTHGLCGSLPLTRQHHLFFFHPGPGTWHLQFDTSQRWSAASRPRVVRAVVVR